VFAGGNLGVPLSEAVGGQFDALVVEVSSFQLERAPTFHPQVSVLLNVSEDHLDRYPSFQTYADAKGNAFVNQTEVDVAIVPAGDVVCEAQASRGSGRKVTFGPGGDYDVTSDAVVERSTGERFPLARTELHGAHNRANAAAAIAAARAVTAAAEGVREGLALFKSLGHRMTLVRELDGVRYYDDSKATNVGAAVTALRGLSETKAVLVAGGRDKLGSYEPLVDALRAKGRGLVVLGEAAERIAEATSTVVPVVRVTNMNDAVKSARRLAHEGDAVLLSPACSSFDMFEGYAERGDRFALAVHALVPQSAS
jgi:UDP-N-acetylmuramoylalanine--D-glutamate ligase